MDFFHSLSEKETFVFGEKIGRACQGGEVLLLCGDLGAGKTRLVQGIASGLGVEGRVNSPTFNILKLYRAQKGWQLCHVDAYRLQSASDLEALGIYEFMQALNCITTIEWAERVKKIWPRGAKIISIKALGPDDREISVSEYSGR